MKRIISSGIIILTFLLLGVYVALGVYSLGTKSTTLEAQNVQLITQTCTDVTTKADCLAAINISPYAAWSVTIKNNGAVALTDLDILIHHENANWDDAAVNLTDAQPFGTDWNNGCTTTLANDTVCQVGWDAAAPVGWLKVQASAGTTTEVDIEFRGRLARGRR